MRALFFGSLMCHDSQEVKMQTQGSEGHHIPPYMFELLMRPPTKPHAHACVIILDQSMLTYRSGILECFNLKLADFATQVEAFKCADHFISKQREDWSPEKLEEFKDQLCKGCPAGDLFWFSNYKGMGTHTAFLCHRSRLSCGWLLPQMRLLRQASCRCKLEI